MAERLLWEQEAVGSSPAPSTTKYTGKEEWHMHNSLLAVGVIIVLALIAYIALYCKHDGAKIGMMKPAKVLGYSLFVIVPYAFLVCVIYLFI